jgi:succinate dehydrogenase/fumarate reductase flavoprotein subunit
MTMHVGVVRSEAGLQQAIHEIANTPIPDASDIGAIELRNMLQVAAQISASALLREESRGGHIRADYPVTDPNLDGQHQIVRTVDGEITRTLGPLNTSSIAGAERR